MFDRFFSFAASCCSGETQDKAANQNFDSVPGADGPSRPKNMQSSIVVSVPDYQLQQPLSPHSITAKLKKPQNDNGVIIFNSRYEEQQREWQERFKHRAAERPPPSKKSSARETPWESSEQKRAMLISDRKNKHVDQKKSQIESKQVRLNSKKMPQEFASKKSSQTSKRSKFQSSQVRFLNAQDSMQKQQLPDNIIEEEKVALKGYASEWIGISIKVANVQANQSDKKYKHSSRKKLIDPPHPAKKPDEKKGASNESHNKQDIKSDEKKAGGSLGSSHSSSIQSQHQQSHSSHGHDAYLPDSKAVAKDAPQQDGQQQREENDLVGMQPEVIVENAVAAADQLSLGSEIAKGHPFLHQPDRPASSTVKHEVQNCLSLKSSGDPQAAAEHLDAAQSIEKEDKQNQPLKSVKPCQIRPVATLPIVTTKAEQPSKERLVRNSSLLVIEEERSSQMHSDSQAWYDRSELIGSILMDDQQQYQLPQESRQPVISNGVISTKVDKAQESPLDDPLGIKMGHAHYLQSEHMSSQIAARNLDDSDNDKSRGLQSLRVCDRIGSQKLCSVNNQSLGKLSSDSGASSGQGLSESEDRRQKPCDISDALIGVPVMPSYSLIEAKLQVQQEEKKSSFVCELQPLEHKSPDAQCLSMGINRKFQALQNESIVEVTQENESQSNQSPVEKLSGSKKSDQAEEEVKRVPVRQEQANELFNKYKKINIKGPVFVICKDSSRSSDSIFSESDSSSFRPQQSSLKNRPQFGNPNSDSHSSNNKEREHMERIMSAMRDEGEVRWSMQKEEAIRPPLKKQKSSEKALIVPMVSQIEFENQKEQVSYLVQKLRNVERLDARKD